MRIEPTSAAGILGGLFLGSCELFNILAPANYSSSVSGREPIAPTIHRLIQKEYERKTTDLLTSAAKGQDEKKDKDEQSLSDDQRALLKKVELLKSGREFLEIRKSYTANLTKREVVGGQLLEEQTIFLKCRSQPFSVYLKWTAGDVGREVIYVDGANDGQLIAHDGGWKTKLPAMTLNPDCMLAMRDARYPVTSAGLLFLIDTMLEVHQNDLKNANFETCQIESDVDFDGRPGITVTTKYKSKDLSPVYRKSITVFDHETSIPVSTEHFEWPNQNAPSTEKELDDSTLVERYSFRNLVFDQQFSDKDFDRENSEYAFR